VGRERITEGIGGTRPPGKSCVQLPGAAEFRRTDFTVDQMSAVATAQSDTTATAEMQEAKPKLFDHLN
jgi:hypothetical protein